VFETFFSVLNKSKKTVQESPNQTSTPHSFFPRPAPRNVGTPDELQERLRNRYIDRLADRVRKLRRELASRNWASIKLEARQIAASGAAYGCAEIAEVALHVDQLIPEGEISRAQTLKEARHETALLIQKIDAFLNAPG